MKQVDALAGNKGREIRHNVQNEKQHNQKKQKKLQINIFHLGYWFLRIEHQFHFWTDKQSNFAVVVCVFFLLPAGTNTWWLIIT